MLVQGSTMAPEEFVMRVLERDARNIYRSQLLIVSRRVYLSGRDLKATQRRKGIGRRTGRLGESLSNPDFVVQANGSKFVIQSNYPLYIRFLDMKRKGNFAVYNRQIWGILFNNALKDIRDKYGSYISNSVQLALEEAFAKYKPTNNSSYSKAKGR